MTETRKVKVSYYAEYHNGSVRYMKENDFGGHILNKVRIEIEKWEFDRAIANGK